MNDVIYRKDAIGVLSAQCYRGTDFEDVCGKDCECAEYMAMRDLPSAQKKGEWLYDEEREATGIYAICSCCDEKVYQCGEWLFCPRCGADMRGDDDG